MIWLLELLAVSWFILAMAGGYPCCCVGQCFCCNDRVGVYEIVISGVVNGSCANCTAFNATFELRRPSKNSCSWEYNIPDTDCGGTPAEFLISLDIQCSGWPPYPELVVFLTTNNNNDYVEMNKVTITSYDCAEGIPSSPGVNVDGANSICDFSGTSIVVNAL